MAKAELLQLNHMIIGQIPQSRAFKNHRQTLKQLGIGCQALLKAVTVLLIVISLVEYQD